ncbi:MAG: hypothetical protein JSS75_13185 [Bacteroidetes bacterium]|nr:hypothetical protein [Bacteroidota bacterium]
MKKHFSFFSLLFVFALGITLASCGAKRDEALVTEFNAKKAEADKVIGDDTKQAQQMMDDHKAWLAKLDEAAKAPKADTAKIAAFKAEIKKMDDMMPAMNAMHDSLKAYANAKTETNDELKAAIAGLNAQLSACTSSASKAMDDHKKLGADITAFIAGPAPDAAKQEPAKKEAPKAAPAKTAPAAGKVDQTKHETAKTTPGGVVGKKTTGIKKQ